MRGRPFHLESCPRPEKKFLYSSHELDVGGEASETTFTSNYSTKALLHADPLEAFLSLPLWLEI